jgi:hypothetical protein
VGLEHRRPEPSSSPAGREWGAELEADCLQDLLVQACGEVLVEQVQRDDINQLGLVFEGGEHVRCETGPGVPLAGDPLPDVSPVSNRSAVSDSCHRPSGTRRLYE